LIRGEAPVSWHNRWAVSVVVPRLAADAPAAALMAAGDPGSSRLVYAMVIGLVVIGVALVVLGVWLVRQTRPDLEVLAPLERMGDREWKKRDPSSQRRMLDEVRPDGAEPLTPEPKPPPIDADFGADHPVASFTDLGPGVVVESRDPTPIYVEAEVEVGAPEATDRTAEDVDEIVVDADEDVDDADDEALSDPRG
jgi:hypothetical protein